jgi:hypothetical protein
MMAADVLPKLRPHVTGADDHLRRARSWLREFRCSLHGHDLLLHVDRSRRRICLSCVSCGYETPGWHLK